VNDLGVSVEGRFPSRGPADEVVKLIKDAGGIAVPSYENVATSMASASAASSSGA
jgi:hypothetical protein